MHKVRAHLCSNAPLGFYCNILFYCYQNSFESPKKVRTRGERQLLVRVHHTWIKQGKAAEAGELRLFQADIIGGCCHKRLPSLLSPPSCE